MTSLLASLLASHPGGGSDTRVEGMHPDVCPLMGHDKEVEVGVLVQE